MIGETTVSLTKAAVPRTTTLAAALLQAAAQGECSAPWHALLAALDMGPETEITAVVHTILAQGATSGADSLAGFLYGEKPENVRSRSATALQWG